MNRMLNKINIKGFKSIRELDLPLKPLNILIGANGSGKSNFIGVFRLLNNIIEKRLQVHVSEEGGADSILHFGQKETLLLVINVSLADDKNGYECTLMPNGQDNLFFKDEALLFHDKNKFPSPYRESLGGGHSETKLILAAKQANGIIPRYVLGDMQSWRVYHFHDTSRSAKVKGTCDLEDNKKLSADAGNLAAFLYFLKKRHRLNYDHIVDAVRMVAPFFEDFALEPSRLNPDKIRLEWKEKGSMGYFNASSLSDGTLRFMCLATLLLQPKLPSTILLDEPELGLHPSAITLLAELLRGASTRTQVIASTQSVTLVNQFEPQDVIVVEREGRESVFRHLEEAQMKEWLDDYGLGDLWEKNLLGGRP